MVRALNLESNDFNSKKKFISEQAYNFLDKSKVYSNDIIITKIGDPGTVYLMPELNKPVSLAMNLFLIRPKNEHYNSKFLYYILKNYEKTIKSFAQGATTKTITKSVIRELKIPYVETKVQEKIVEEIQNEEKIIENNKKLIDIYNSKINNLISKLYIN